MPPAKALAERIRTRIEAGDFASGDRLHETRLADALGETRSRVREALRLLAAQNIVALEHQRGASVVGMDRQEARDWFRMRVVLWGLAVEFATMRATDAEIDGFNADLDTIRGHLDNGPEAFIAALIDLQAAILAAARIPRLVELFRSLTIAELRRYLEILAITREWRLARLDLWQATLDAMRARDAPAARAAAERAHERGHHDALQLYDYLSK